MEPRLLTCEHFLKFEKPKKKRKSGYLSTKGDREEGTVKRTLGRGSGRRFGSIKRKP